MTTKIILVVRIYYFRKFEKLNRSQKRHTERYFIFVHWLRNHFAETFFSLVDVLPIIHCIIFCSSVKNLELVKV